MRSFGVSVVFSLLIASTASAVSSDHARLLHAAVRAFHGQRCGTAVDLGAGYKHGACHLRSAFHPSSGKSGTGGPVGGWHDAGDYGRYVVNSGIATGTLLWAWEFYEGTLRSTGLLDEARWNLEWMLAMQDEDGGVWHKQTSLAFPPFVMPEADNSPIYVIGKGSCATANLAAVAAIASRVYSKSDVAFAQKNLGAATRAWQWLKKNPDVTFRNPKDVTTGEYGDGNCDDERLWAAAELWRSAGDADAHAYFLANARTASMSPPSWNQVGPLALWSYVLAERGEARLKSAIKGQSLAAANRVVSRAARHRLSIPMRTEDFVWGSNAVAANYGLQLLVANRFQPDKRYVGAAAKILDYLLGQNPFGMSYVTGYGRRSVMHPHHRPSGSDTVAAPWPGLLAGGPNRNRQDPVLKKLPPATPPAEMYADDEESYASNEVAINWNAPLVFLLAGLESSR